MKPTYGRISRYGQIAFASSLDQIGPMTNSVEDAALICQVMSGEDELDSTTAQVAVENWQDVVRATYTKGAASGKGLRVGVPAEYFIDGIEPEVRTAIDQMISELKNRNK